MRATYTLTLLLLITVVSDAQDFDADSIYYTEIPKIATQKFPLKRIFIDTTTHYPGVNYFFNVQVGPLIGCNDCSLSKEVTFTSSTTHGVTIGRKLRTGIGIGLDSYYSWQTLPLFGSVSWDLIGTKNTQALFMQFNYGWSFIAWRKESSLDGFTDVGGGRMISPQIGYRVKYHDLVLSLAAGAKMQQVFTYYESPSYYYLEDGTAVEGSPNRATVKQDMSRLMISVAIGWK